MTIRSIASLVVGLAALIAAAPAVAQKYDFTIQNAAVGSAPIEQPHPAYPSKLRSGQEGWVRVNYVITPDGKAVRPIVIDSSSRHAPEVAIARAAHQPFVDWSGNCGNLSAAVGPFAIASGYVDAAQVPRGRVVVEVAGHVHVAFDVLQFLADRPRLRHALRGPPAGHRL